MKRWLTLLTLGVLLTGSSALAQIDPDTDGIGIYKDLAATIYCAPETPNAPFDVYLVLTNPSALGGVSGWELQLEFSALVFALNWGYQGQAVNAATPPEFAVGLAAALPWAPAINLMTITMLALVPTCEWIHIIPTLNPSIPGELVYADGVDPGNLIIMRQSTGGPDEPVYGINCDCPPPIATDEASWGNVKNLYR
jgi:hypothetical protein